MRKLAAVVGVMSCLAAAGCWIEDDSAPDAGVSAAALQQQPPGGYDLDIDIITLDFSFDFARYDGDEDEPCPKGQSYFDGRCRDECKQHADCTKPGEKCFSLGNNAVCLPQNGYECVYDEHTACAWLSLMCLDTASINHSHAPHGDPYCNLPHDSRRCSGRTRDTCMPRYYSYTCVTLPVRGD